MPSGKTLNAGVTCRVSAVLCVLHSCNLRAHLLPGAQRRQPVCFHLHWNLLPGRLVISHERQGKTTTLLSMTIMTESWLTFPAYDTQLTYFSYLHDYRIQLQYCFI